MRQRAWAGGLILGIGLWLLAAPAQALILKLLPVNEVLGDSTFVFTAKVDALDKDGLTTMLVVDEHLKGKWPFLKLPIVLKGDDEAAKGKQTPELLKRLAPQLPLVLFVSQRDQQYFALTYTNGTWLQLVGVKPEDANNVRWSFTHLEPYLRRTYKGTTEEMKQVVVDVLAGKRKPPAANPKEKPGLGPEVAAEKPKGASLKLYQGPVFGVIPSVLIGGPLAVLSMLFPTLFGGWRRWLAFISVVCTSSTLYLLHWYFAAYLNSHHSAWGSPVVLWIGMSVVTLWGCIWAWWRHLRLVESGQAPPAPGGLEQGILFVLSVVGVGTIGYCFWSGDKPLTPAWMLVLVTCIGAWVGTVYVLLVRRGERQRQLAVTYTEPHAAAPSTAIQTGSTHVPAPATGHDTGTTPRFVLGSEVVMLTAMALASLLLTASQQRAAVVVDASSQSGDGLAETLDDSVIKAGRQAWRFPCPKRGSISSTPLVAGDRVYFAVAEEDTFKPQGVVYCVDSKTGKPIWNTRDSIKNMKMVSLSSPCLAGGRLYIGEGFHEDVGCKLHCIDTADGKLLWQFDTGSHVESSPLVFEGKVYFGAGDDGLYCADAKTGKQIWHFPGVHVDSIPLVHRHPGVKEHPVRLYAGSGVGDVVTEPAIVCLDAENGSRIWQHPLKVPAWGGPVLAGDLVYFGTGNGRFNQSDDHPKGALLCVQAATGDEVWRFEAGDGVLARPTVDQRAVYFGSRDGHVYCVNRKTGKLAWKRSLGSPVVTTPAPAHCDACGAVTSLYVLAADGQVYCLGGRTGRLHWSSDLVQENSSQPQLWSSPAVSVTTDLQGQVRRLYFGVTMASTSNSSLLYCFEDHLEHETPVRMVESRP